MSQLTINQRGIAQHISSQQPQQPQQQQQPLQQPQPPQPLQQQSTQLGGAHTSAPAGRTAGSTGGRRGVFRPNCATFGTLFHAMHRTAIRAISAISMAVPDDNGGSRGVARVRASARVRVRVRVRVGVGVGSMHGAPSVAVPGGNGSCHVSSQPASYLCVVI